MLPRIYLQKESPYYYQSNGYGFIKYCKKCEVTEELNGEYTLSMIVHPYDKLANEIKINRFIKAKPNSRDKPQLFEINHETGEIRSNIFYCDAQTPSQKPHVENNHEFIINGSILYFRLFIHWK